MDEQQESEQFFIVGVGASAGGLAALTQLVANLPDNLPRCAIIIAQHLSPDYESKLQNILEKSSEWPVITARDGLKIEAGKIYVTPPSCEITVEKGYICLKEHAKEVHAIPTVDILFNALAKSAKNHAIGVVLSGTGQDGTEGIKAIKKNKGYVLVQAPDDAQQSAMPSSAIQSGYFDKILSAKEIGKDLRQFIVNYQDMKAEYADAKEDSLQLIFNLLVNQNGTDFSRYKPFTILRRIKRRLDAINIKSIDHYYEYIKGNPDELNQLFNTILIGVTNFFRDKAAFEALRKYLSKIIELKEEGAVIRLWSVGCASGEEPFSIAILLEELLEERTANYTIQIFATDINDQALGKARKAYYTEEQLTGLSPDILSKYFVQGGHGYEVKKKIRQRVLFSKHDITKDPPFVRLDLISCRNLLIYFDRELQREVIPVFHYALREGGYLLLGKSENISELSKLFGKEDGKHKIFFKKAGAQSTLKYSKFRKVKIDEKVKAKPPRPELSIEEMAEETLVKTFEHPYVVMDESMEVAFIKGQLQPFVDLDEGSVNTNLLHLISKVFHMELRTVFAKVKKDNTSAKSNLIPYQIGEATVYVRIMIKPLLYTIKNTKYFMVIFERIDEALRQPLPQLDKEDRNEEWQAMRILELEQELLATKEHLHAFTEELETSNEELQSLNEELQSANEELKSANEEMETTNEELQSANEELSTANAELVYSNEQLQLKEDQLVQIKEDLELNREMFHLALENSNIILFHQDDQLRYSWEYNTYSKIPKEEIIGKNDLEINNISGEDVLRLHQSKEEVLHSGHEVQIEIRIGGKWYDLKIKPILKEGKVSGINGVGIDITDRKTSADIVERNQSILSNIINQGADNVLAVSKDYKILALNNNVKEDVFQRLNINLSLGDNLLEKLKAYPDRQKAASENFEKTFKGEKVQVETYLSTDHQGSGNHYYDGVFFPIMDLQGEIIGGANIAREVTERILLEQQVQEITKRSANLIGDEFFKDLTDQLATLFHMQYVYIGVFQDDEQAIRTLAFRINGVLVENFEYSLKDTPCAVVADKNKGYHMEQVRKKFPRDEKLQRWNAESYVGIPITSPHTENSIGILVMMDQKPWQDTPYTDYLLTLQSIRAGAELERMSAEQRIKEKSIQLENISNNVPGVIYEVKYDDEGKLYYTYISEACESIFGFTQQEFLNEVKTLASAVHEDDREAYLNERERAINQNDDFHFEGRIRTKQNQIKWVKFSSKALKKENRAVSWYGFVDDITQIKEVEAALHEAKNEAEKAARAKEDFLATMSHEIRTPLNAIIGLSNLLLKKDPRQDQLENFRALKFSSESLMNLINDILDYSKMEAGKVELEVSDYNIRSLLHSIRQAHLLHADEKNNVLRVEVEENVPEIIKGDQVKLAQVLNNLVSNANKFTKGGNVTVEVKLEKEVQDDVYLHFAVKDTGIGISPENAKKIFEKFTQADSSTVRHYGGTGLGLSITKALLEMQDSEIKVESEEQLGSVFSFILKQRKGEMQPEMPTNQKKSEDLVEINQKRIQILLVEDVAINRMVVQQYLEEWWNTTADEATNGIEAVERVKKKVYDVILMDIRMPEMDGYEAAECIRKLSSTSEKIPILALTADTTAEFKTDRRAKYINDVITKPFSPQDLFTKITRYTSAENKAQWIKNADREADKEGSSQLLTINFKKAEEPFRQDPHKIVRFYEMVLRSLSNYRDNYCKALRERDNKMISEAMHKAKVLIDMLDLGDFHEKMYRTRRKMEAAVSDSVIEEESKEISKDIDQLLIDLQIRLDTVKKNL